MPDIMQALKEAGFKPEVQEDDSDFSPIKGKYRCRIDRPGRVTGSNEKRSWDFHSLKMQIVEVVDGESGLNRYIDCNKFNYNVDEAGRKQIINDLHTAGIETKGIDSDDEFDAFVVSLQDRIVCVRAWRWTPDKTMEGVPIPEGERQPKQMAKIVKEFSAKATAAKRETASAPF